VGGIGWYGWQEPTSYTGKRAIQNRKWRHGPENIPNKHVLIQVCSIKLLKMTVFWYVAPCTVVEISLLSRKGAFIIRNMNDGGSKHLWNVGKFLRLQGAPSQKTFSYSPPWEPKTLISSIMTDCHAVCVCFIILKPIYTKYLWDTKVTSLFRLSWCHIFKIIRADSLITGLVLLSVLEYLKFIKFKL
jgi:hypothetical protein